MKWLKRGAYVLLALVILSIPAYWWLFAETHDGSTADYAIDIAEVRRLADSHAGPKPESIRVETVAHLAAPQTFVVAGSGWQTTDLPVSAYELVYPEHIAIVDTALNADMAHFMTAPAFDKAAYTRVTGALNRASLIIVTHEHPDHIGGLLAQPNLRTLLGVARLTPEQVTVLKANLNLDAFAVLHVKSDIFDGYRPLAYGRYQAIAPGVVLIKAPGHTPGSQMVYVRRADGAELLLLGDVAWQRPGVDALREKARFVSWLSEEDRGEVRAELAALHQLHASSPEIHMLPGHDAVAIDRLVQAGLLIKGF